MSVGVLQARGRRRRRESFATTDAPTFCTSTSPSCKALPPNISVSLALLFPPQSGACREPRSSQLLTLTPICPASLSSSDSLLTHAYMPLFTCSSTSNPLHYHILPSRFQIILRTHHSTISAQSQSGTVPRAPPHRHSAGLSCTAVNPAAADVKPCVHTCPKYLCLWSICSPSNVSCQNINILEPAGPS